jgi:hypothetical protein
MESENNTKYCSSCKIEKPLTRFGKHRRNKDGLRSQCKECERKYNIQKYQNNKEYYKEKNRHRYLDNKEYHVWYRQKNWEYNQKHNYRPDSSLKSKICSKCKKEKSVSEFYKQGSSKSGYTAHCKQCKDEHTKQLNYQLDLLLKFKICTKCKIEKTVDNFNASKQSKDGLYPQCKQCLKEYKKEHYEKPETKQKRNKYGRKKRKEDPNFNLIISLRNRVNIAIKKQLGKKALKTIELLGCSIEECRQYLESQFQPGMNWDNHGVFGWHIDHIIPCSSFNLTDPEEQKKCFHYTNLQPLWAEENLKKRNFLTEDTEICYCKNVKENK